MSRGSSVRSVQRSGTRSAAVVLIYGEGKECHDQDAIARLASTVLSIEGRQRSSNDTRVRFKSVRSPVSFSRRTDFQKKRDRLEEFRQQARAWKKGTVVSVIVHRDSDKPDPRLSDRNELLKEMQEAGLPHPIAAVAVVDIECWFQAFPTSLRNSVMAWRALKLPEGSTDTGHHSKDRLKELTRKAHRMYKESDSELIAVSIGKQISAADSARPEVLNKSWSQFVADLLELRSSLDGVK